MSSELARGGSPEGPDWTPVDKVTTVQAIVDKLLTMVRQGALKVGDQLPAERVLMEKLGVGRSSIREAIQILSTLNVLTSLPGHGTFVKEPRPKDILRADLIHFLIGASFSRELLEARQTIEPAAVGLACLRGTDEDFARIDALLVAHRAALSAGQPIQSFAARFHGLLAAASHNSVFSQFMETIIEILVQRGRSTDRIPGYAELELEEHREIFDMVRARDAAAATRLLSDHINRSAITFDVEGPPW